MFFVVYCEIAGKKATIVCESMVDCDFIEGFVKCSGVKFLKDTSFNNCDIIEISFSKENITHYSKASIQDIDISADSDKELH